MTGFKTLLWNLLLVVIGAVVPFLAGVNWTDYVSPTLAAIIVAVVNVALRYITTTPMFQPK